MQSTPMPLIDTHGVYADAALTDDSDNLLFLSLWGRDTAIQELRARLSLPAHDGGLSDLRFEHQRHRRVQVGDPNRLDSETGRTGQTLFGPLIHLWLYDRIAQRPDMANRRALMLCKPGQPDSDRLWALVTEVCHLPLLPHWREPVLQTFHEAGWIQYLEGTGIDAYAIHLAEEAVEETITRLIKAGRLTID